MGAGILESFVSRYREVELCQFKTLMISLDAYMVSLRRRTLQLCVCIEERCDAGTGTNLTELFQHWAYDIMV